MKLPSLRSATSPLRLRALRLWGLLCCLLLAALFILAPSQQSHAAGGVTATVEADTFIDGNEPNKGFGGESELHIKENPPAVGFVRFAVSGAPEGVPLHATLRLFVIKGSGDGAVSLYAFHAPNEWDENGLTWNLQPALGDQLGATTPAPLGEGSWVAIDLGGAVTGDGVYSFAITGSTPAMVSFAARTRTEAPELLVSIAPPPPSTTIEPTATPAETATAEPTPSLTPTATPVDGATPEPTTTATTEN